MRPWPRFGSRLLTAAVAVAALVVAGVGIGNRPASGQEDPSWVFGEQSTTAALSASTRVLEGVAAAPDGETQVLYGGGEVDAAPGATAFEDTWTWTAGEWTARCGTAAGGAPAACGPGPRNGQGMGTGPGGVILYGGSEEELDAPVTVHSDTWRWDGSSWTQVCTDPLGVDPCGPLTEVFPAMAGNGSVAVLFGGFDLDAGPAMVDDTWVFDGSDWTQVCGTVMGTPCGPTARALASMAWDGEQFVLFGGADFFTDATYGDTWVLDPDTDTTWTQVCADGACGPDARMFAGFAYLARPDDASLRGAVLAGGFAPINQTDDTAFRDAWFWNEGGWSELDVPWDSDPIVISSDTPPPGEAGILAPVLGSRNAECQVVFFGTSFADGAFTGTDTYLGGWDIDGDGEPGDCAEVVPTTTSSSTSTTAPPATTVPTTTASPATLPATGATGSGATPLAAGALGLLAGVGLVVLVRYRSIPSGIRNG